MKTERPSTGVWRRKGAKSYFISFRWRKERHTFVAFTDAKLSARLRQDLLRLLERADAGEVINANKLGKRLREILVDLGVVEPPASTDPIELVARYRAILLAKGDTLDYVDRVEKRLQKLISNRKIKQITDLKAEGVQLFIGELRGSSSTKNHYLRSAKSFSKWMFENEILPVDPLARLHLTNTESDRIRRRIMTDIEFDQLIEATTTDGRVLSAKARRLIYYIARYSGLRVSEIASLTRHSLEGNTLVVMATNTKNRKEARQLIPSWLAEEFREYAKESLGLLFPGRWYRRAAEMMWRDLDATGIKRKDGKGYRLDFHSLRHSFVTGLAVAGVSAKDAQTLARHSTITLTMETYTHLDDQTRLAGIVESCMPRRMPVNPTDRHGRAQETDEERVA